MKDRCPHCLNITHGNRRVDLKKAIEMNHAGKSTKSIAEKFGVSVQAVNELFRRYSVKK